MEQRILTLMNAAKRAIPKSSNLRELEKFRVRYLGKKGELTLLLKKLAQLPSTERARYGKSINLAKQHLQVLFNRQERRLQAVELQEKLSQESLDVTLSGRNANVGGLHPITQIKTSVIELFTRLGFSVIEGPEIEDEYHNFEALNMPAGHPARAMQDTFYIAEDNALLRTQTSPVQIRGIKKHGVPIRMITSGRVYRRDSDQKHTPMFHQVEGLVIDKQCNFSNLKSLLRAFLHRFFDTELKLRFRPSYFPFTVPSAELDIYHEDSQSWLEILGCGMVHPDVLRNVGVNPDQYTGFAFGLGLDRLAMIRYNIPDLRILFNNDLRFLKQFT